jgi:hypothetical protein
MSVHISGDGLTSMDLHLVRRFVEATKNYPENTRIKAGVVGLVGKGTAIAYEDLQGLETA